MSRVCDMNSNIQCRYPVKAYIYPRLTYTPGDHRTAYCVEMVTGCALTVERYYYIIYRVDTAKLARAWSLELQTRL
jgi:hypothetical protein|eukprot:SAG25_NODE_645_length_6217_cov_5.064237_6_plen_76_part_00